MRKAGIGLLVTFVIVGFIYGFAELVKDPRQETRIWFPNDTRDEHPRYFELADEIAVINGEVFWRFDPEEWHPRNRFDELGFYHWSEIEKLLALGESIDVEVYFSVPWDNINLGQRDIEFSVIYVEATQWARFWEAVIATYPELAPQAVPEQPQPFIIPPQPTPDPFSNDIQA